MRSFSFSSWPTAKNAILSSVVTNELDLSVMITNSKCLLG